LHPHENPPTLGIIKFDKAQLDLTRFYIYEDYKKDISLCQY
jgi:hypothetical protein